MASGFLGLLRSTGLVLLGVGVLVTSVFALPSAETSLVASIGLHPSRAHAESSEASSTFLELYGDLQKHSSEKALGDPDAPVTITEYVDLRCPYCRKFNRRAVPKILRNHVRTGEVYYRIRHFPLDTHEQADAMANMAECAREQDAFFKFKHLIFSKDGPKNTRSLLEELNLENPRQFNDCVRGDNFMDDVVQEKKEGMSRGVSSTPTIFIDDRKLVGAHPYETVRKIIEAKLE